MSNDVTKRMLSVYIQNASPTLFLSGLFQSPPRNFYNSEAVEIDIVRTGEEIAIVVQDLSAGGRLNSADLYTNKKFVPPILKEKGALNAFDMIKRQAGTEPFADFEFQVNATERALLLLSVLDAKIRRTVELQAAQVLQTGKLNLIDSSGIVLYTLDFKPKATHFPTAPIIWSNTSAVPISDLEVLAEVLRSDGLQNPDTLIMGSRAFEAFVQNDGVQKRFDNRRFELGTITPMEMRGQGGNYRGQVTVGNYNLDVWTYGGRYVNPQTKVSTTYVDPAKVIMRASAGRLDATFGAIPVFGNPAAGILPYLPPRLPMGAAGMDIFANAWLTADREQLFISAGSRPLMIPTAIDTFGCLDTGV